MSLTTGAVPALAAGATPGTPVTSASSVGSSSGSAGVSSLQTQAQELASEINADGRTLDQLDASYDADRLTYNQLQQKQVELQRQIKASSAAVAAARAALKQQALLDYITGGAPIVPNIPDRPGMDPTLTVDYASILAGAQKRIENNYATTLASEASQEATLAATAKEAALALKDVKNDQTQAYITLSARQQALAQVKGQLAVEVAAVQAQQQQAEEKQVKQALSAQGELPASTVAATGTQSQTQATAATQATTASTRAPVVQATSPTTRATVTTRGATPTTQAPAPPPTTAPPAPPNRGGSTTQAPGVNAVLSYARAQLGKPYQWGGAGPDSFDCSGLVMRAWEQAGIEFPHLAQDQYNMTTRIPLSAMVPGDLVFFGTPNDVYHVGIYIGNGNMIDAPETGQNVSVQNIYWSNLLGAGRVTTSS